MIICYFLLVFLFKQKTAYEMRISDWSSDVCSSDLVEIVNRDAEGGWRVGHAVSGSNSRSLRPVLPSDMRSASGRAKRSESHMEAIAVKSSRGNENQSGRRSTSIATVPAMSVIAMPRKATFGNSASNGCSFSTVVRWRIGIDRKSNR